MDATVNTTAPSATAVTPLGGGGGRTFQHGEHTYRVGVRGGVQRKGGRAKKFGPVSKSVHSKLPAEVKERVRELRAACKSKSASPKKRRGSRKSKRASPKKRRRSAKKSRASPKKRRRSKK